MSKTASTIYDNEFFEQHKPGALVSARIVVPILLNVVKPRTVIDVGCGHGAWLRAFHENGVQLIKGFDGSYVDQSRLLVDRSSFAQIDLSQPFKIDERCELVTCLEVAEHLPQKRARAFVQTLTEAAPLVLFSAAIPGQESPGHINMQWPSYWQAIFKGFGFHRLDPIRRHIWHDDRVEWWYRQNIYLYASEAAITNSATLQREREFACTTEFELIHLSNFYRFTSLRGIIRELPRVAKRKLKGYLFAS